MIRAPVIALLSSLSSSVDNSAFPGGKSLSHPSSLFHWHGPFPPSPSPSSPCHSEPSPTSAFTSSIPIVPASTRLRSISLPSPIIAPSLSTLLLVLLPTPVHTPDLSPFAGVLIGVEKLKAASRPRPHLPAHRLFPLIGFLLTCDSRRRTTTTRSSSGSKKVSETTPIESNPAQYCHRSVEERLGEAKAKQRRRLTKTPIHHSLIHRSLIDSLLICSLLLTCPLS